MSKTERNSAMKLFLDIPKSTVINIHDKLSSHDQDEQSSEITNNRNASNMTSTKKLTMLFGGAVFFAISLCTVIFALAVTFSRTNRYFGRTLAAAGGRKNACVLMLHCANELIVNDETTWTRSASQARAKWAIGIFTTYDNSLKYGNVTTGVHSKVMSNKQLYNLWYNEKCPSDIAIPNCKGLGTLTRSFVDDIRTFCSAFDPMCASSSLDPTLLSIPPFSSTATASIPILRCQTS
jgi:hypothetical protein